MISLTNTVKSDRASIYCYVQLEEVWVCNSCPSKLIIRQRSPVVIFVADDVVFFKIVTYLDFGDNKLCIGGDILDTMLHAFGHGDKRVLTDLHEVTADRAKPLSTNN